MKLIRFSGRKFTFFGVCLLSGFLRSLFVLVDSASVTFIPDPILFGVYTIVGGLIVTLLIWTVLAFVPISGKKRLGNLVDNNFRVKNLRLPFNAIRFILLASAFNALGLIIYLYGVLQFDPSLMLPLMQFVVLYLMLTEFIASKDLPTVVEIQSIVMITLGAFIVTINPEMELDLFAVFLVLFPLNLFTGLMIFFQKKALHIKYPDGGSIDAITTRVWTVFGLFIFYGLLSLPLMFFEDRFNQFFLNFSTGMILASISMIITFFAAAFRLKGLSMGKTYIVNALVSISVVFSIPITLFAVIFFDPLIFGGEVSLDPFLWILKSIGSILIFIGIVTMVLSEVRGYVLVKIKVGMPLDETMQDIQKINGVISVSSLFGEYDLIVYYRIRSIGKVLRLIIREIAQLPGVDQVSTQIILDELNKF
ncbi:MAG: Lrp/AsnC ligand binding domain-containing protein [Candidatus Hodarchaeales archaeon]